MDTERPWTLSRCIFNLLFHNFVGPLLQPVLTPAWLRRIPDITLFFFFPLSVFWDFFLCAVFVSSHRNTLNLLLRP
jgi:hypothetical protein